MKMYHIELNYDVKNGERMLWDKKIPRKTVVRSAIYLRVNFGPFRPYPQHLCCIDAMVR